VVARQVSIAVARGVTAGLAVLEALLAVLSAGGAEPGTVTPAHTALLRALCAARRPEAAARMYRGTVWADFDAERGGTTAEDAIAFFLYAGNALAAGQWRHGLLCCRRMALQTPILYTQTRNATFIRCVGYCFGESPQTQ
jgi:hypothetical protein